MYTPCKEPAPRETMMNPTPPPPMFFPTSWLNGNPHLTPAEHQVLMAVNTALTQTWRRCWDERVVDPDERIGVMQEFVDAYACQPGDIVPRPHTLDWVRAKHETLSTRWTRPWAEFLTVMLTHAALHAAPTTPAPPAESNGLRPPPI